MTDNRFGSLINLNVGGKRFSTSKETLTWINDSFFSSLLSGRISSHRDELGYIFIDRDPKLFRCILNFLRTKEIDFSGINLKALKREAEYFGIHPLVARLTACEEVNRSSCGNVLFYGMLQKPSLPRLSQNDRRRFHPSKHQSTPSQGDVVDHTNESILLITGHNSWIAVAYSHCVLCYKIKESCGWQQVFSSPFLPQRIRRIAINAKVQGMAPDSKTRMVAVAFTSSISLWSFQDEMTSTEIGTFDMAARVDALFFIGSQLVATGGHNNGVVGGRVGVWNAVSQHWQTQDVNSITSYDSAGTFLLLGGVNGTINYIDMQKFPLRLKDNDLLITELYRDPASAAITALSVYLTPKNNVTVGNWIEVAYGTATGTVCVIVQHPELVGQGFQLFQTFTVHRNPVSKVMLSEKHLVSVCSDNNHVRTWTVTRFRGMISTQPGSTPLASFKILALEPLQLSGNTNYGNNIGPHGEREEIQIFIQKLFPVSDQLFLRTSSTGERIAEVKSVDGSSISCFCLHECESPSRMGSRPRRYLFTGHANGAIQIWDVSTALELFSHSKDRRKALAGPTQEELLDLLGQCDLHVSPHHALSLPPNCSPSEMSYLLNKLLLRSSCHSLVSNDPSDGAHEPKTLLSNDVERSCDPSNNLNNEAFSRSPSTTVKVCPQNGPFPHSYHRRGHSEGSPLTSRNSASMPSRLRHSHSVSADPCPSPSQFHSNQDESPPSGPPATNSGTNV